MKESGLVLIIHMYQVFYYPYFPRQHYTCQIWGKYKVHYISDL